ncbi:MAG TPA: DMT family transporter [Dehalococcoidia bacterium]|nr:DMT family transporter [Dehalococcoidia bacterium]
MQAGRSAHLVLFIGVAAVSSAAVLIREADAPALVIAAYRLGLAALPMGALALATGHRDASRNGLWVWPIVAGGFLALHFGFWIASLQQTSVITSVVLVTTNPLFVGLASPLVLRERVSGATWAGIGIATVGAGLMAAEDLGEGLGTLAGDLYALLGAVFGACYLMIGRRVRPQVSWAGYVGVVYSVAAVLLVASVVVTREPFTGYSTKTFLMLGLLALVPQLVGHSAINWSLAYVPAALVAVAILGEAVGATILAAIVLEETPSALEIVGALLVLAAVYVALRPGRGPAMVVDNGRASS